MEPHDIIAAIIIGLGATFLVDLWNTFLARAFGIRSLDYCLLGRWIGHMPAGTFRHTRIAGAAVVPFECALGWIAHYSIGAVLAVVFLFLVSPDWLMRPTLLPALLYGTVTVVFPMFVLQPSLGLGIASSKTPNPLQARVKSLMTHIVFGFGLWVCAIAAVYVSSPAL